MRKRNFSVATAESEQRAQLPGVHQVIADEDKGLTFAAIGRVLLSADVDVMFIRELFDYETAELAFRAVLDRNKFVFTALHCQNTMATINRLTNMDIDPWLIAEAVSVIQGQRLLRQLCPHCKEEAHVTEKVLMRAGLALEFATEVKVFRSKGCAACGNTGYHGMLLVAETFRMTESFAMEMLDGPSMTKLGQHAVAEGMKTLRQSALTKLLAGLTSLEEVLLRTPADP
jgi:type IV pilus assembly protein PilB